MNRSLLFLTVLAYAVPPTDAAAERPSTWSEDSARHVAVDVLVGHLEDPLLSLEVKRAHLRHLVEAQRQAPDADQAVRLSAGVARARPVAHQHELCLELATLLPAQAMPTSWVRVEALDSWGAPAQAVVVQRGVPMSTGFARHSMPTCLPGVLVRYVPSGETVLAPIVDGVATAHQPGPGPITALTAVAQLAWGLPGWAGGDALHFSGGARVQTWRHYLHVDFALKVSTFSVPSILSVPAGFSVDAFAGVPIRLREGSWEVRSSIAVGLWATLCPSLRLSAAVRHRRFFAGLDLSTHLHPLLFWTGYRFPAAAYVFWSAGLAVGYAL